MLDSMAKVNPDSTTQRTSGKEIASVLRIPAIVALAILAIIASASASEFPKTADIGALRSIIDAGFRGDYATADSIAVSLQDRYPDHPIGYVMQASMLQSEMLDDEHFEYEEDFYSLIKLAVKKGKAVLEDDRDDAWVLYCLGLAHGSHAVYDSRAGSWWSALRHGIKSKGRFNDCIEADSTFYDAYVGLGSYHYWRTVKTKVVNWIPFVQDDREQGLQELDIAVEKGRFTVDFARNALIWVWIDMGKYEEAESLSIEMQNKYPEGRKFLWSMAYARLKQDKYLGAEAVFTELIARISKDPDNNNFNIVECRYQLAKIYFATEEYSKCIEQCNLIDKLDLSKNVRNRLKRQLKESREIEKQAERALDRMGTSS